MSQVKRESPAVLIIATSSEAYTFQYNTEVAFEGKTLQLHADSWVWGMLESLAEEAEDLGSAPEAKVKQLSSAIGFLCRNEELREILDAKPAEVHQSDIRSLFEKSDVMITDGKFPSSLGARAMGTFRQFVLEHAQFISFAEPITAQTIRFVADAKIESRPRALISDLSEWSNAAAEGPISALKFKTIPDLKKQLLERASKDIESIRTSCIQDMEKGAMLRKRAEELLHVDVKKSTIDIVRKSLDDPRYVEILEENNVSLNEQLSATLKVIAADGLYRFTPGLPYQLARSASIRAEFLGPYSEFKSHGILEISHHACPEELFAAIHLIHTYVGWNFTSVMRIDPDTIRISRGYVVLQGYKSKTDDDTPVVEIPLDKPGIEMAVKLIQWNRIALIEQGHVPTTYKSFWCVAGRRKNSRRPSYLFHPVARLRSFQERYSLPNYSLEQVRNQTLFIDGLSLGGLQAAQVHAGHRSIKTTAQYISGMIEELVSSSVSFDYIDKLGKEVKYLFESEKSGEKVASIQLLQPIGDGASCADPMNPPAGRMRGGGQCSGERCHRDGGCPNRHTVINDARIEEVCRTRAHYRANWQDSWLRNPDNFILNTVPAILYTEALHRVISGGPYAWKLSMVEISISKEM